MSGHYLCSLSRSYIVDHKKPKQNEIYQNLLKAHKVKYYLLSCFILLVPVLVWNFLFIAYLPEAYYIVYSAKGIPLFIKWAENLSLLSIFILALLMPLKIKTRKQKAGLAVYIIGLGIYLLAWRPLILFPAGDWSTSLMGFTSLAFTPLILLIGIGLIGKKLFYKINYHRYVFIVISFLFIFFRTWHSIMVYNI